MRTLTVVLLLAAALSGPCDGERAAGPPRALPFTRLVAAPFDAGGFPGAKRLVVRDAAAWAEVWAEAHAGRTPAPPRPAVDFPREAVIVAAMGERPHGGHAIAVAEVRAEDGGATVRVESVSPGAGCMTTQALQRPLDLVRVALPAGEVRFVEVARVEECADGGR